MNKEFKWDDDLVRDFALQVKITGAKEWIDPQIIAFKASHTETLKRDWEIIEFRDLIKDELFTFKPHPDMVDLYLASSQYTIHSVRRLLDNSVWTVGDKFNGNAGHEVTIKGFDVVEGREPFPSRLRVLSVEYGGWDISRISKPLQRTPLPPIPSDNLRIQWLEDRVAYIEKILKIDQ